MAVVLKLERDPGKDILRLLRKEIADARTLLQSPQADGLAWRNAIHDARRALRRARALLRLLPADADAHGLAPRLREAGHALSPLRDAQAMLETLATVARQSPETLGTSHAALLAWLTRSARVGERTHVAGVHHACHLLQAIASELDACSLECRVEQLWDGVRHSTARAAKAARRARANPDEHNLHRWRRRAREQVLQLELLADCWPAVMSTQIAEHKRLVKMLGHLRDLTLLQSRVQRLRRDRLGRLSRHALVERLRLARAEQLSQAMALGALVHAERPRSLIARIAGYQAAASGQRPAA